MAPRAVAGRFRLQWSPHDLHRQAQPHRPVGLRHAPRPAALPPLARGRRGRARAGGAGVRAHVRAARHRAVPGDDLRGDGARHAALRRLRRRPGQGQGGRQPGEEGGGRGERLRHERGALAPHANAAGEPRADGVPGRGPDAEGRRDARDGRQSHARLRARVRAAGAGEDGRSPRAAAAERAGPHVRAIPRVAQGPRHHALGRGRRHAREHLALRRRPADGADGRLPSLRLAAPAVAAVRVLHGLPHRPHARRAGGGERLRAARLPHAAQASGRGDRGGVSGDPARKHPRVDAARQEPRPPPGTALGRVGESRRASGRGRLEGAVGSRRVHRLGDVRAHLPRRLVEGRRRRHARLPLRRLRGDGLDVQSTMSLFSPTFELPVDAEGRLMQLDPAAGDFAQRLTALTGGTDPAAGTVSAYAEAIRDAAASNMPLGRAVLRVDDFLPEKSWSVLASVGYICDDPYTGAPGVTLVAENVYRVTTRLATRKASSLISFTLRLMEPFETTRQVFSPLLVRFLSGVDHTTRPVKISDSGRIRNELQTMIPQALEHDGERIRVRFERINEMVLPRNKQETIRAVLRWYKVNHPVWFDWLELDESRR